MTNQQTESLTYQAMYETKKATAKLSDDTENYFEDALSEIDAQRCITSAIRKVILASGKRLSIMDDNQTLICAIFLGDSEPVFVGGSRATAKIGSCPRGESLQEQISAIAATFKAEPRTVNRKDGTTYSILRVAMRQKYKIV